MTSEQKNERVLGVADDLRNDARYDGGRVAEETAALQATLSASKSPDGTWRVFFRGSARVVILGAAFASYTALALKNRSLQALVILAVGTGVCVLDELLQERKFVLKLIRLRQRAAKTTSATRYATEASNVIGAGFPSTSRMSKTTT